MIQNLVYNFYFDILGEELTESWELSGKESCEAMPSPRLSILKTQSEFIPLFEIIKPYPHNCKSKNGYIELKLNLKIKSSKLITIRLISDNTTVYCDNKKSDAKIHIKKKKPEIVDYNTLEMPTICDFLVIVKFKKDEIWANKKLNPISMKIDVNKIDRSIKK